MKQILSNHAVGTRQHGFTLTELLVAIVMIAALAAIILVVTNRVRDQAITATDIGKLKQVSLAVMNATQENNGIIPHGNQGKPGFGIPGTATSEGQPNRYNFHEMVDRFFPAPAKFNAVSIYNYETREDKESIYCSNAAKPWAGYKPSASRKLPGPLWFSFNSYLNHGNWAGNVSLVPNPSRYVLVAETNHMGGEMRPATKAETANNKETRYRVSRPGMTALYLYVDGHVEQLEGDRGETNIPPGGFNMWRWW